MHHTEEHSRHIMARMSSTLVLMLPHADLMQALFETLDPCEESFRYLTHLACVCKAWQLNAMATRFNSAWQLPLTKRAIAYHNNIEQARSHLDLNYFIAGIVDFFSSVTMQESIIPEMIIPSGVTHEECVAVITRFRQVDASKFVPLLAKVGFHHIQNFQVFYTICKIGGILCQQDDKDNSQQRTQICVENKFLSLFFEGVTVHKNVINIAQYGKIFAAITKLGVLDSRVIRLGVYCVRCYPDSVKFTEQFLYFLIDRACDERTVKYVLDTDFLQFVIDIATKHITNTSISNASCHVLAYFALKNKKALSCIANEHGMLLLLQVIQQHTELDTIKAYLRILKAVARDPDSVALLHTHDIIPRILVRLNLRNIGRLVTDADGVCDLLNILSYCVCDLVPSHRSMVSKLIEHGIVHILHTIMLAHVHNHEVHLALISLLSTMSSSYNLKAQYFNDQFMQTVGTNFVHCMHHDFMVAPMFTVFATLIETSEKGRWTDMVHRFLAHITSSMILHMDHVGVQEAGSKIIMLMARKRACRGTPLNVGCVDSIVCAANFHKTQSIYTFCLEALTNLMNNAQFRAHMLLRGAVFLVLEALQNADALDLISLCLVFLSHLENGEHNAQTSFKFMRYMCSFDKEKNTFRIENVEALIAKSLERPGITENLLKMAGTIRSTKFE